jgi:hypothetical protein
MCAAAASWTCPTCERAVSTPFCPICGERPLHARDLALRGLVDQSLKSLSSVDGRVIRSFRTLVNQPGALTVAYLRGQRKPYIGPFPLFVIANVLFFLAQSLTGVKIFSTPLESHLTQQDWSPLAHALVARRLEALHMPLELYAPLFNQAVSVNAKSLIILMALAFAALLPVMFRESRRPLAVHLVFSLHVYAFLLLLFCVMSAVAAVDVLAGGAGLASSSLDKLLSVINLAACAGYVYLATGKVFGGRGAVRIAKAAALTVAAAAIVLGYRFVLFLITLYTAGP